MADIQIGVIGNGLRGQLARLAHRPEEGVCVTAVCDVRSENLEGAKGWYGPDVRMFSDYHEMLADKSIDAVFVLTPDYLHEEHACAALETGKAVYLENPMAITVEGGSKILGTAVKTGTKLYVGHNMRHATYLQEMKRLIDRGDIGEVKAVWCRHCVGNGGDCYFRDWHADRRYSNTLLLQKGAHDNCGAAGVLIMAADQVLMVIDAAFPWAGRKLIFVGGTEAISVKVVSGRRLVDAGAKRPHALGERPRIEREVTAGGVWDRCFWLWNATLTGRKLGLVYEEVTFDE